MNNSVVIKGIQSGLIIVLDPEPDYTELRNDIVNKFSSSADFLGEADIAISFEGRELSNDEIRDIIEIIHDTTRLNVVCVLTDDPIKEALYEKSIEDKLMELSENTAVFHKGTLRSGQTMEVESGIIILGDVNSEAKISARGNIIVLGSLAGTAIAGTDGNESAFIVALDMKPMLLSIADYSYSSASTRTHKLSFFRKKPEIAFVLNSKLCVEEITKDIIHELRIN